MEFDKGRIRILDFLIENTEKSMTLKDRLIRMEDKLDKFIRKYRCFLEDTRYSFSIILGMLCSKGI
jgi:hypothetical protein